MNAVAPALTSSVLDAGASGDCVIRVEGVSKCFPIFARPSDRLKQFVVPRLQRLAGGAPRQYYREFWALRDASLEVRRGDSIGLIGRNGSGKSTLLQLIAGTQSPTSGEITVRGRVSALLELGSGFNLEFTGRENIYLNAAILGLDRAMIEDRLDEILAFADIGEFVDQPLKTYSSGMIMRLAFSVAVCIEPEILIVDEALAVGDAAFQYKCLARIRKMIDAGMTFLFVSHDLAMVRTFCERAVYLCRGQVAYDGTAFDAGEAYLQELRAAQRMSDGAADSAQVAPKAPLPGSTGSAFGTRLGNIREACFAGCSGRHAVFQFGAPVEVTIEVEYGPEVLSPCVALAITDSRHVNIGGRYSQPLAICPPGAAVQRTTLCFRFEARLAGGQYHMTVVLEDRASPQQSLLVDKQGGVLSFEMLPQPADLIGTCDLGVSIETHATCVIGKAVGETRPTAENEHAA